MRVDPSRADFWTTLGEQPAIDWLGVESRLPVVAEMAACVQDPTFHAEGDVWTHTRMVVESLRRSRAASAVRPDRWSGLVLAALLHDIAKPATRSEEIDPVSGKLRVHHYGHARRGAVMAWEFLWREGVPRPVREQVFHLVRWHQRPFHLTFAGDLEAQIITYSQVGLWNELLALAEADNLGRIAPNAEETATSLGLLRAESEERGCLRSAWPFASDAARVWFCREAGRSAYYAPQPPAGSKVIVMSGLPGAGKDTTCNVRFPGMAQISFDAWRQRLDIAPDENQGRVIQAAYEEARQNLRAKVPFVWNATNVSRLNRDKAVGLCLDYDADVEILALDTPPQRLFEQNKQRDAAVPEAVMNRLIAHWEPPSVLEAHRVSWVD